MSKSLEDRALEDWEYPEPDESDDDFVDTVRCPECGREVYEESPSCPGCGYFILATDRRGPMAVRSMGWMGLAVAIILIGSLIVGFLV